MADEKAEQAALGNLIRQKRQARGLSQEQLAQQLEVSRQAVAKWESGKGFPSAERLLYLAQVLDIPAEALLGRAEEKEGRPHCPLAAGGGNGCTLDRIRNPVLCRRGTCNGLDSAVDICQSVRSLSGALGRCADIAPDLERRSKRIEEPGESRVFCIHTSFCTPHYVIFQIALGADLCYNTNTIYAMMRKEGTGDEGSFQFEGAAA